jgi:hypothetical protein
MTASDRPQPDRIHGRRRGFVKNVVVILTLDGLSPLFRPNEPFWKDNARAPLAALVHR